jgi:hypothetical protein
MCGLALLCFTARLPDGPAWTPSHDAGQNAFGDQTGEGKISIGTHYGEVLCFSPRVTPSKRTFFGAALVLRVPLGAGPSHVMKLGPIGFAGDLDQSEPPRHDHIEVLAKRPR